MQMDGRVGIFAQTSTKRQKTQNCVEKSGENCIVANSHDYDEGPHRVTFKKRVKSAGKMYIDIVNEKGIE
jgi:hypothetical protein